MSDKLRLQHQTIQKNEIKKVVATNVNHVLNKSISTRPTDARLTGPWLNSKNPIDCFQIDVEHFFLFLAILLNRFPVKLKLENIVSGDKGPKVSIKDTGSRHQYEEGRENHQPLNHHTLLNSKPLNKTNYDLHLTQDNFYTQTERERQTTAWPNDVMPSF